MEQIRNMFKAMENDADFTKNILEQAKNGGNAAAVALAKGKGFDITEDEWQKYMDWSASVTESAKGRELNAEELDDVAGGTGKDSKKGDLISPDCWFFATGNAEMKFGAMRKRCGQFACRALPFGNLNFYWCKCHDKDRCIDNWHLVDSHAKCPQ